MLWNELRGRHEKSFSKEKSRRGKLYRSRCSMEMETKKLNERNIVYVERSNFHVSMLQPTKIFVYDNHLFNMYHNVSFLRWKLMKLYEVAERGLWKSFEIFQLPRYTIQEIQFKISYIKSRLIDKPIVVKKRKKIY